MAVQPSASGGKAHFQVEAALVSWEDAVWFWTPQIINWLLKTLESEDQGGCKDGVRRGPGLHLGFISLLEGT